MITFFAGLFILLIGGVFYSRCVERIFAPDDRPTPAYTMENGVDFVPIDESRNALIQFLNIAGTGPILGPILGILFGPVAFILIPLGNIFAGAVHDYFCGMISMRNNGEQMPQLVKKYLGAKIFNIYNIFLCLTLFLVGAVFLYLPGDLFVEQVMGRKAVVSEPLLWEVYGVIFIYYLIAMLFPIDKIIGRLYPVFGGLLLFSSVAIGVGLFVEGYLLDELSFLNWKGLYPNGDALVPMFFVTVACGIVSGFHASQTTLISRTLKSEKQGRFVFYGMMVAEGVVAMIWAAAAMGLYNKGIAPEHVGKPAVVGLVAKDLLGVLAGTIAIFGMIILPITSGDTALRAMRLIIAENLNIDQRPKKNRLAITLVMLAGVAFLLYFAKLNGDDFIKLWRYFAWSNQTIAVFTFTIAALYLIEQRKTFLLVLIPGTFYFFVVTSYILHQDIGFGLSDTFSYMLAGCLSALYAAWIIGKNRKAGNNLFQA